MAKSVRKPGAAARKKPPRNNVKSCLSITRTGLSDIDAARDWLARTRCRRGCVEIGDLILCASGTCTAIRLCRRK
jgi:hypothetical protein